MRYYYNTTKERLQVIKNFIKKSSIYERYRIKFESAQGDVLYLKRYGHNKYERFASIANIFNSSLVHRLINNIE